VVGRCLANHLLHLQQQTSNHALHRLVLAAVHHLQQQCLSPCLRCIGCSAYPCRICVLVPVSLPLLLSSCRHSRALALQGAAAPHPPGGQRTQRACAQAAAGGGCPLRPGELCPPATPSMQ
jgi:hypothetical protein